MAVKKAWPLSNTNLLKEFGNRISEKMYEAIG